MCPVWFWRAVLYGLLMVLAAELLPPVLKAHPMTERQEFCLFEARDYGECVR